MTQVDEFEIKSRVRIGAQNIRKLLRFGDHIVGFGPKEYFVMD